MAGEHSRARAAAEVVFARTLVHRRGRVVGERDRAVRAFYIFAASAAGYNAVVAAAVQKQYRLFAVGFDLFQPRNNLVGEDRRISGRDLASHIDGHDLGKVRISVAVLQLDERIHSRLCLPVGGERRRCGRKKHERFRIGAPLASDIVREVFRRRIGFVGVLLLLVDHDKPEIADGGEHRRARADHDIGIPVAHAPPCVVPFAR